MASTSTEECLPVVGDAAYRDDRDHRVGAGRMESSVRSMLVELGEDPTREGLARTPERVAKAFRFLTSGYEQDIDAVINNALFTVDYSEMVIVKDIEFYSLCEHHMLPFFGKVHVGYLPSEKVLGLSKIPRIVEIFARRLQVQERLTSHQLRICSHISRLR